MDDMRVLVTYATVHGSTAEIARAIALTLCRTGIDDVDVLPASEVQDVRPYDSVVAGSAVYGGRWRKEAVGFLERFGLELFHRDVWLFQSGPLGHSAQYIVRALPVNVGVFAEYLRVKGAATFGGKLDGMKGGPVGKFLARAGFGGDYRDFEEIRLWAEEIARAVGMRVVMSRNSNGRLSRAGVRR